MNTQNTAHNTLEQFIKYAKRNGIELDPCDHFTGEHDHKGKKFFNVVTGERNSESSKLQKLYRLSDQYRSFKIEPNGFDRLAIFPA